MSEGLSAILGLILPLVIDVLKKRFPSTPSVHYIFALVASLVVGVFSVWLDGELVLSSIDNVLLSMSTALAVSQTVYKLYWKDSELQKRVLGN
jgi:hypothetical protein